MRCVRGRLLELKISQIRSGDETEEMEEMTRRCFASC